MEQFTDITVVHRGLSCIVAKGQRYGRWWALKALKEELRCDEAGAMALRKEFAILMSMQHPHIVDVVGFEFVEELGECIVMEWLDAQPLTTWLQSKHTRSERLHVARQILCVHKYICEQKDMQHGFTPSDVMVMRYDQHVKLIGFAREDGCEDVIAACSALERMAICRRAVVYALMLLSFFCVCLLSWNRVAINRQTIASLEIRIDSAQRVLSDVAGNKQALNIFIEEGQRFLESRAHYDLDTLNTFKACCAAERNLCAELEAAFLEYCESHPVPVSYDYAQARLFLWGYSSEILAPLYDKCERLRIEEGYDGAGNKIPTTH